jgi:RNA polymerase sigma-70 factor, ECF subfamily
VDAAQFRALYERHRAPIFSFLLRMGRDEALARDLSQETWLRLAASAHTLRPDSDHRAWLFTVARNLYRGHHRWRVLSRARLEEYGSIPARPTATPSELASAHDTARRLERAIARLPARYREVILLISVEGIAQEEVARILDLTLPTLRQRLSRARALLKTDLEAP